MPGAGALVANARSRTPGNSIDINGPSDLVHQYAGYTAGTWTYRAWQYIPTGFTGTTYFIMLNDYAYPSGPYSWSVQLEFNATTGFAATQCGGAANITMPYVLDQWVPIDVVIDLDQDWVQIHYNGTLFDDPAVANHPVLGGGYQWSLGMFGSNTTGLVNLGALDLYANNASSVYYDDFALTQFEVETIGRGCPGSLPTSRLVAAAPPRLGHTLLLDVDNLPISTAFLALGFSTVAAAHGALPFDLAAAGMPNCWQRVSDDIVMLLVGSGGRATYSLGLPNAPGLLGVRFHTQAVVPDAAAGNARGAVISDAATVLIGL